MNRRGFISSLGKAIAAFTVLPPAVTYARKWAGVPAGIPFNPIQYAGKWDVNTAWITAEYEVAFVYDADVIPILEGRALLGADPYPIRYEKNEHGLLVRVYPLLEKQTLV